MANGKLTTKQRLFVEAYLANPNGTEAARKAGYSGNDNALGVIAFENLRKPKMTELLEQRVAKFSITADEVLSDLVAIKNSEEERTSDRLKALELLGKYLKLFTERVEVSGTVSVEAMAARMVAQREEMKRA